MRTLVLLQAAKAFFVAANTTMNLLDFPGDNFVRPFGVSQQLSAHSSAGNATTRKLLLYKIRLIQPSDTCDGLVRVLANLIAEFQETALLFEVRVVGRGNGVLQTGMVRQRHMETGHACVNQQWSKSAQLRFQNVGIHLLAICCALRLSAVKRSDTR